jgi:hypothetical protein
MGFVYKKMQYFYLLVNLAMPLKARITVYGVTPVQAISCTVLQAE